MHEPTVTPKDARSQAARFKKSLRRVLSDEESDFIVEIWKSEIRGTRLRHLDDLGALDMARDLVRRRWLVRDLFNGSLSLSAESQKLVAEAKRSRP